MLRATTEQRMPIHEEGTHSEGPPNLRTGHGVPPLTHTTRLADRKPLHKQPESQGSHGPHAAPTMAQIAASATLTLKDPSCQIQGNQEN